MFEGRIKCFVNTLESFITKRVFHTLAHLKMWPPGWPLARRSKCRDSRRRRVLSEDSWCSSDQHPQPLVQPNSVDSQKQSGNLHQKSISLGSTKPPKLWWPFPQLTIVPEQQQSWKCINYWDKFVHLAQHLNHGINKSNTRF